MHTPREAEIELRYPIGRFHREGEVGDEQRERWLADLAAAPMLLAAAVDGLTDDQLDTPYRPGGWTVRQLLHHVPDSHLNAYVRFKLALTEDEPTIKPYDEAAWAELGDTRTTPPEASLRLLQALHERWVALLSGLSAEQYRRGFRHPEHGRVMTLEQTLGLYAWHGRHHTAQVTRLRERMGWG